MKKTSFLAAFSLLTAVLLASCATTRAYVEGIDDYEKQEIGTKGNRFFLNDANTISWGERTLKMPETTQVSTGVGLIAFGYVKSWEKSEGEFSVGGKPMFPTEIYITDTRKSFLIEKEKVRVVLSTGSPKTEFEVCDDEVVCTVQRSEGTPLMEVRKTWEYQKGEKVSKLWRAGGSSGFIAGVDGENYALIDVMCGKPTLYLNKSFAKELSDTEKQFADSVLMALYYILDKMNGTLSFDGWNLGETDGYESSAIRKISF